MAATAVAVPQESDSRCKRQRRCPDTEEVKSDSPEDLRELYAQQALRNSMLKERLRQLLTQAANLEEPPTKKSKGKGKGEVEEDEEPPPLSQNKGKGKDEPAKGKGKESDKGKGKGKESDKGKGKDSDEGKGKGKHSAKIQASAKAKGSGKAKGKSKAKVSEYENDAPKEEPAATDDKVPIGVPSKSSTTQDKMPTTPSSRCGHYIKIGDKVDIWSESENKWFCDGFIEAIRTKANSSPPAVCAKIVYNKGAQGKWLDKEALADWNVIRFRPTLQPGLYGANTDGGMFGGGGGAFGGGGMMGAPGTTQPMQLKLDPETYSRFAHIGAMDCYKNKSFEELRFEDYQANRVAEGQGAPAAGVGMFSQNTGGVMFGQNTGGGLFGQNTGGRMFGANTGGGLFGQNTGGGLFGQNPGGGLFSQNTGGGMFGQNTGGVMFGQNTGGVLFGQNTGGGMFGANTGGGLFGQNTGGGLCGQNTGGGLFGQNTGGGMFSQNIGGGMFGQDTGGGLFGAKPSGGGLYREEKAAELKAEADKKKAEKSSANRPMQRSSDLAGGLRLFRCRLHAPKSLAAIDLE